MEDVCFTSGENNVEGLRWRQGHKPPPGLPAVTSATHQGMPDTGDDGLSTSKYLLGALALVVVGLLIITGKWVSQWPRPQGQDMVQMYP